MTIFYCLRFETLPTWRAKSPYLYPPRNRVPFSSPPTTPRATVEVFELASTRDLCVFSIDPCYVASGLTVEGSRVVVPICFRGYLITKPLSSNECFLARIATIVQEVRCRYSAPTSGRWSCRGQRCLANA
jgi:hypothetical protein